MSRMLASIREFETRCLIAARGPPKLLSGHGRAPVAWEGISTYAIVGRTVAVARPMIQRDRLRKSQPNPRIPPVAGARLQNTPATVRPTQRLDRRNRNP